MEKGNCEKCKRYSWIEKHHILPQCEFGEQGEVVKLCPNCHTDYHQYLGTKNLKGNTMEYHFMQYFRWFAGIGVVVIVILLLKNFL